MECLWVLSDAIVMIVIIFYQLIQRLTFLPATQLFFIKKSFYLSKSPKSWAKLVEYIFSITFKCYLISFYPLTSIVFELKPVTSFIKANWMSTSPELNTSDLYILCSANLEFPYITCAFQRIGDKYWGVPLIVAIVNVYFSSSLGS